MFVSSRPIIHHDNFDWKQVQLYVLVLMLQLNMKIWPIYMKCVTLQFYLHHVSIVFKCASVCVHRHVYTISCSENESENWIQSLPAQPKKKYIQQNTTKMHKMLYVGLGYVAHKHTTLFYILFTCRCFICVKENGGHVIYTHKRKGICLR